MCAKSKVPFEYGNKGEFSNKLAQWIDHVFYDVLPEQGYEIREEQIYTAFHLANAVCKGKIHFAEAGLGTGKTFAYLLTAVSYARFSGKPVVIACASTALQEQLAGPGGDIDTLSRLLDLDIDSRMAKDPRQYLCDIKVNRFTNRYLEKESRVYQKVLRWIEKTNRGERSEIPQIPDPIWKKVAWDETMPCDMCSRRGFCKLVKTREHYRTAQDLIIADHGTFFDDLWTRDEQIDNGMLPLLPPYSAVLFDEGHKIMLPAAMRAGRHVSYKDIKKMVATIGRVQGARPSLVSVAVALELVASKFFNTLNQTAIQDEQTERLALRITDEL
ncbi:MAG: ATP-dependent DNA helicase, partial [Clostridia bacterium]|nr:ATP-dependent DNA helicase [Clostridia bacterium]